jgi:hypothetical protein
MDKEKQGEEEDKEGEDQQYSLVNTRDLQQ